jgi:uracil-DNA glycosylase
VSTAAPIATGQAALDLGAPPSASNALARPLRDLAADLPEGWRTLVLDWLETPSGRALAGFVDAAVRDGREVYPVDPFRALRLTAPDAVRAVILGQDPYHGPGEAEGLAFSVAPGVRIPPSLRNIRAEWQADLGDTPPVHGSLVDWARQGVLLLNASLTVARDQPASHARRGWEDLTDHLVDAVAARPGARAYLLWGAHAQAKADRIRAASADAVILASNHPSPLAARRPPVPFLGSRPFSRSRDALAARGVRLDWGLRDIPA